MSLQEIAGCGNRIGNRMLATGQSSSLSFSVVSFVNRRTGSASWRVTGSGAKAGRVRKNYSIERGGAAAAQAECDRLNAEEIRAAASVPPMRAMPTRLSEAEIMVVEAAKEKAKGRWSVSEILDVGLQGLEQSPVRSAVAPLLEEWLAGPGLELNERWREDVEGSCRRFLKDHAGLMTNEWTIAVTRRWLDGLKRPDGHKLSGQTKAGIRNALHRFAGWLVERGFMKDNPAAGLWITRAKERQGLPTVYTVGQVRTMFEVCQADPVCRPLLGWLTLTMLCGLRPEGEAPELRATQIRMREREIILKGQKRGSKPRIVPLQPAAVEFLRVVLKEAPAEPGFFTRGLVRRLDRFTDSALRDRGQALLPEGVDINRHTYASMRAAMGVQLPDLAKEMGNDVETLYGHYIQPLPKREALKFWAIRPAQ